MSSVPDNLFIFGFYNPKYGCDLVTYGTLHKPQRREVDICKQWIATRIEPRKMINHRRSSSTLAHDVEWSTGQYIPNGAFIQAAIELGFEYEPFDRIACFNMCL